MSILVKLTGITSDNYDLYYQEGSTSFGDVSSDSWGTELLTNQTANEQIIDFSVIDANAYGKEYWFKIKDLNTNSFLVKNLFIHSSVFYNSLMPTPTSTPVPTNVPTETPTPTSTPTPTPTPDGGSPTQTPTATPVPTQTPTATPVADEITVTFNLTSTESIAYTVGVNTGGTTRTLNKLTTNGTTTITVTLLTSSVDIIINRVEPDNVTDYLLDIEINRNGLPDPDEPNDTLIPIGTSIINRTYNLLNVNNNNTIEVNINETP